MPAPTARSPPDLAEVIAAVHRWADCYWPDRGPVYLIVRHPGRRPTRIWLPRPPRETTDAR